MQANKSCCISAVRSSPDSGISVSVAGFRDELCFCLGSIVCTLIEIGIPVYMVFAAVLSGIEMVGEDDA